LLFKADEWRAAFVLNKKKVLKAVPTANTVIRLIAQIVRFLGRKSDGEPGAKTRWLGMRDIAVFVQGLRCARKIRELGRLVYSGTRLKASRWVGVVDVCAFGKLLNLEAEKVTHARRRQVRPVWFAELLPKRPLQPCAHVSRCPEPALNVDLYCTWYILIGVFRALQLLTGQGQGLVSEVLIC
jgi:hypothetical protein